MLALTTKVLERAGYRVIGAGEPQEALGKTSGLAASISLIVADVMMPGGTSVGLVASLAAAGINVPVLLMSGYEQASLARKGLLPEGGAFIQKPFIGSDLVEKVGALIGRDGGGAPPAPAIGRSSSGGARVE